MSKQSTGPAKGMRDFLPHQTELRDWLTSQILATYRSFGFERIETPVCEDIKRLRHSDGGENLQLLFEIMKRGSKLNLSGDVSREDLVEMGLRFDLTVPLVRYYSEHRAKLTNPFKAVQVGSVWRAERPQKGRYRQFTQCDIDIIGGQAPETEIELLLASTEALRSIGFSNVRVKINDRRLLTALATQAGFSEDQHPGVLITLDKADKIGVEGVTKELYKREYDKSAIDWIVNALSDEAPSIDRFEKSVSAADSQVFEDLRLTVSTLSELLPEGSEICFDPFLVRGMGYYTGQIFEIEVPNSGLGSIGGGGRYDEMIGKMSGKEAPACGFSIGFERVFYILEEQEFKPEALAAGKIALFFDESADFAGALNESIRLRADGKAVSVLKAPKKMKSKLAQLKEAGFTEFAFFKRDQSTELKVL